MSALFGLVTPFLCNRIYYWQANFMYIFRGDLPLPLSLHPGFFVIGGNWDSSCSLSSSLLPIPMSCCQCCFFDAGYYIWKQKIWTDSYDKNSTQNKNDCGSCEGHTAEEDLGLYLILSNYWLQKLSRSWTLSIYITISINKQVVEWVPSLILLGHNGCVN